MPDNIPIKEVVEKERSGEQNYFAFMLVSSSIRIELELARVSCGSRLTHIHILVDRLLAGCSLVGQRFDDGISITRGHHPSISHLRQPHVHLWFPSSSSSFSPSSHNNASGVFLIVCWPHQEVISTTVLLELSFGTRTSSFQAKDHQQQTNTRHDGSKSSSIISLLLSSSLFFC